MTYTKELHDETRELMRLAAEEHSPANDAGFYNCSVFRVNALLDEIERLQKENATLREQTRWIPVEEIKKRSGARVIVHMENDYLVIATYFRDEKEGHFINDGGGKIAFESVVEYKELPLFECCIGVPLPPEGLK